LTARLSDGWYLYHQDLKVSLSERGAELDQVTFFEGLGSVGDKAQRVAQLAAEIAPYVGANAQTASKAAMLAKADLVTGMVGEFPELQGVMGRYYALEQNEEGEIADAIRDHYKPQGQDDDVPSEPIALSVALADKIDTLTGFWSIDKKPTGSSDPFALRRAALGVIRIILTREIRYPLPSAPSDILEFFHDRLKVYLRDHGHRHDHVEAVLKTHEGQLQDDVVLIVRQLKALEDCVKTDDGENLVAAFKRAANILKAERKNGELPSGDNVSVDLFEHDAEKTLFATLENLETEALSALVEEDFQRAMTALAKLRAPLDGFFETVTVNADDQNLRANRLALLVRFRDATNKIVDFTKLEGR